MTEAHGLGSPVMFIWAAQRCLNPSFFSLKLAFFTSQLYISTINFSAFEHDTNIAIYIDDEQTGREIDQKIERLHGMKRETGMKHEDYNQQSASWVFFDFVRKKIYSVSGHN
jgi:hypothetical protein